MLNRFHTYEQAALFVAMKRDQGYYAEILHEHSSVMWGPLVMGGVAAWVSEFAAEDGEEVPVCMIKTPSLPSELSQIFACLVMVTIGWKLLTIVQRIAQDLAYYTSATVMSGLRIVMELGLSLALYGFAGWLLSKWVHSIWDETHRMHRIAKTMHVILAVVLLETRLPFITAAAYLTYYFLS